MDELWKQYEEGLITFVEFTSNMLLIEDEYAGTVWNRSPLWISCLSKATDMEIKRDFKN